MGARLGGTLKWRPDRQRRASWPEVIVKTDKNIRYQQNLKARKIALVVLENSQWPMVKLVAGNIAAAVSAAEPGSYRRWDVPFKE